MHLNYRNTEVGGRTSKLLVDLWLELYTCICLQVCLSHTSRITYCGVFFDTPAAAALALVLQLGFDSVDYFCYWWCSEKIALTITLCILYWISLSTANSLLNWVGFKQGEFCMTPDFIYQEITIRVLIIYLKDIVPVPFFR